MRLNPVFYNSVHIEESINEMSWFLGPAIAPCEHSYNHLGIVVNHMCKFSDRIHEACSKGRTTFFALPDLGTKF